MARETPDRPEEPRPVITAGIAVPVPVPVTLYPPEDPARGAEMKIANLAQRFVTLGWNPRQVGFAFRIIVPVVARESGAPREQ